MATMIRRTRGVDRARHERLDKLLNSQDGVLRSRMQTLRDGLPTGTSGVMDVEEHSLDAEEQGVGLSVLQLTSQTVQGIEMALQRLDAGDFGACSDCRSRIPAARLRALPFAVRCRACQEQRDIAAGAASRQPTAGWNGQVAFNRIGSAGQ